MEYETRNSSVDEIGERYRLNFSTAILNFPITLAYLIGESRLFRRIVTFLIIAPYNTLTYLLTDRFLVDNHL